MRRFCGLLVLLSSTVVGSTSAQEAHPNYFPLAVGNEWTYIEILDPPYSPPDTFFFAEVRITAQVEVNDTTYFIADVPYAPFDTIRADAAGQVWARKSGRDQLLFDFTCQEDDHYQFESDSPGRPYNVNVFRDSVETVAAGSFQDVISFWFWILGAPDSGHNYTFAPGIGMIYLSGPLGSRGELQTTNVPLPLPTETPPFASVPGTLSAYPNPFRTNTTFTFEVTRTERVRVTITDLLGRILAVVVDEVLPAGPHEVTFDASGLPNGAYVYHLSAESGTVGRTVVLAR